MPTILCMDGLAGNPEVTFRGLRASLESDGHKVVMIPVEGIVKHGDRIRRVMSAFKEARQSGDKEIVLLGFSAGGNAVRIAAERLWRGGQEVSGVILMSQAMPLGYWYMTKKLLKTMAGRLMELVSARDINTTPEEYSTLMSPVSQEFSEKLLQSRGTISGKEARRLAFMPYRLRGYNFPTLVIYGSNDNWVSTKAHRQVAEALKRKIGAGSVESIEVMGSGHLPLVSEKSVAVINDISSWIKRYAYVPA